MAKRSSGGGGDQSPERIYLFDPADVPAKGMRSAPSPASLAPGLFADLENLRFDNQNLYVRNGITQLASAGPTGSDTYQGSWYGLLDTQAYAIFAFDNVGSTGLYALDLSTYAWNEITHTSGRNGNTRMTEGNKVAFAAIKDLTGYDVLVVSNGVDEPRIYDPNQSDQYVAISNPISPYLTNSSYMSLGYGLSQPYTGGLGFGLAFQSYGTSGPGNWAITPSSSSEFNLATQAGLLYGTGYQFTVNTTVTGDPTILMVQTQASPLQAFNCVQLGFIMNGATSTSLVPALFWNSVKVEIGESSTGPFYTLWDPSAASGTPPAYITDVDPANAGTYMVAYTIPATVQQLGISHVITTVRLTYVGTPPSALYTVEMLGMTMSASTGSPSSSVPLQALSIQGGTQIGFTFFNSQSRAESAGTVVSTYQTSSGFDFTGSSLATWSVPYSPLLQFQASLSVPNTNATQIGEGVDTVFVYWEAPGALAFTLLGIQGGINAYTGSWPTGTAGELKTISQPFSGDQSPNPAIYMPDGFAQTIPIGSSLMTNNGRLVVGGVGPGGSEVWVSDLNGYTRFLSQVDYLAQGVPDQTSATVDQYPGEQVIGLGTIGGNAVSLSPIIILTNQRTWRINGLNVTGLSNSMKVVEHGCIAPWSICEYLGELWWMDEELEVVRLSGGSAVKSPSKKMVDDQFFAGSVTNASIAQMLDRVYVLFQSAGESAQQNALVYESFWNEWCGDDYSALAQSGGFSRIMPVNLPAGRQLWLCGTGGTVYRLEDPSAPNDAGEPIPVTITGPMLHDKMWWRVKDSGVGVATAPSNAAVGISRYWLGEYTGNDGSINLGATGDNEDSPPNSAWLYEVGESQTKAGGSGLAVQHTIFFSESAGFQLFGISVEFEPDDDTGAMPGG